MCFTWACIWNFLNSTFFTALVGAMAGAWAGAFGAHKIAEAAKQQEQLLQRVAALNIAIRLCHSIVSSALSVKEQLVRPMKGRFDTDLQRLIKHRNLRDSGAVRQDETIHIDLELQEFPAVDLPTDLLTEVVVSRLVLGGPALTAFLSMVQSAGSLNTSIRQRNDLIQQFKGMPQGNLVPVYFGLPIGGNTHTGYKDLLAAISTYTDDVIFFTNFLYEELRETGHMWIDNKHVTGRKKTQYVIAEANFSLAISKGLMPPKEQFQDWLRAVGPRARDVRKAGSVPK